MNWVSYAIMAAILFSMGIAPVFAQESQQFAVKDAQSGQSYTVSYSITGATVNDVSINPKDTSIIISLTTSSDGNLTMTIPRSLIDAKAGTSDDQFFVLVDGADTDFTESKTDTNRTLTVSFPQDTTQIEVIGTQIEVSATQVVPEFGGLSFIVLMAAIVSIVVISTKTRLKFS